MACNAGTCLTCRAARGTSAASEVFETSPDKSVAKVLPQFRKGAIEKDDHVRTPIN